MILAYLLLLTGLTISSVAIYYSVVGLTAIFSAAATPIMIMGVSLEVAKLVCATWIKQHWSRVPVLMKTYMVTAVAVLMLITSMGIFGFLSKAHNDQNLVSGDVQSKIAIYDEKIKTAKDNIDANRKALKQMDEAVDQVMGRSTSETGADKAVAIRRSQQKERSRLQSEIASEQKVIAQINEERAPIAAEVRKVEAEVGPIKYIAKFIYGDSGADDNMLEKAVTWIIILIVIVFDPLAVIMLLASQMTFGWYKKEEEEEIPLMHETVEHTDTPEVFVAQEVADIIPEAVIKDTAIRFTDHGEHPRDNFGYEEIPIEVEPDVPAPEVNVEEVVVDELVEVEPVVKEPAKEIADLERPGDYLTPQNEQRLREAQPGPNRGVMQTHLAIQADNSVDLGNASSTGFGTEFPTTPNKGDIYLRIDYLPNRLFKFNGSKWIEVDKTQTDVYAYEEQYIKYLIDQIDQGNYELDSLTDVEREQIAEYLKKNAQ